MMRRIYERMSQINQRYGIFMDRMMNVETIGALIFIVTFLGSAWAFAWNAHVIGPWVDNLMGWGPHDIDSEGKVRWRRMWSTAICLPGILAYIILYIRNRRK